MTASVARRTLVFGLDAFEPKVARALIAEGRMPGFQRLLAKSARFELDHGPERDTGLAWHQFATGQRPSQSGRWSAIRFDPRNYNVEQPQTDEGPFTRTLGVRTVAFDVPHFNLVADPLLRGIANWGCHDAGVPRTTRPEALWSELIARFGEYPAEEHIYGIVWGDAAKTARMGRELVEAVKTRSRISHWLLAERLPDWDLAILTIAEFHSVIETMWHGWDQTHPLNSAPSAASAKEALIAVYEAGDRLVADLMDAFPDATVFAFAPHGMGANHNDVGGMILMAELMHRYSFGTPGFMPGFAIDPTDARGDEHSDGWSEWVNSRLALSQPEPPARGWLQNLLGRSRSAPASTPVGENVMLDWMPTARYRPLWPRMKAFAIPAYHDARIRINLKGREAEGVVALADYRRTLDEIADIVRACAEIPSGRPVDVEIQYTSPDDPMALGDWQTDIVVRFKHNTLGLIYPDLGPIGPVPHRRTGGHTGGYGAAYVAGPQIAPGDYGVFSTFDVVPVVADLALGRTPDTKLGKALAAARTGVAVAEA